MAAEFLEQMVVEGQIRGSRELAAYLVQSLVVVLQVQMADIQVPKQKDHYRFESLVVGDLAFGFLDPEV